jgi:hypothetical protein
MKNIRIINIYIKWYNLLTKGCCEGKNSAENYYVQTIVNPTKASKRINEDKIYTLDSNKGKKVFLLI